MLQFIFWFLFLCWLIASAVLILVVLVQSGKGGGLSGLVGAGSTLGDHLGATGAEKTLNRWTTYCAVAFVTLTIILVFLAPPAFQADSPFYRARAIQTQPVTPPAGEETALPGTSEAVPGAFSPEIPTPAAGSAAPWADTTMPEAGTPAPAPASP